MSYVITPEEETFKSFILGEYKEVRGHRVVFQGWEEFSFFVYRDVNGWWHLIEESTGLSLPGVDLSREWAVKNAADELSDRSPDWFQGIINRSKSAIDSGNYYSTDDLVVVPCGE